MKPTTNFVRNHKRRQKKITPAEIASVLPTIPEGYSWVLGNNPYKGDETRPSYGLPYRIKLVDQNNKNIVPLFVSLKELTIPEIKKAANELLNNPTNKNKLVKLGFSIPEPIIENTVLGKYN
jgi:hypothetical protein